MNLLILKCISSKESSQYRGTERITPYHIDELGDEHKVNKAFLEYCSEGNEYGIVHNLTKAKELIEVYRQLDPPQHFEIVEVTADKYPPETQSKFLGFDLSSGYHYSLLSWGLDIDREPPDDMAIDDKFLTLQPLLRLTKKYFQPRLNLSGLFEDYDTANFCLECMLAMQKIRPGLWENDEVKFEVIGLWEVISE